MPRKKNPNPRHLPENSQLISQNQLSDIESLESDIDLNELPGEELIQLKNIVSEDEDEEWDDRYSKGTKSREELEAQLKKGREIREKYQKALKEVRLGKTSGPPNVSKAIRRSKRRKITPQRHDPTPLTIKEKKIMRETLPTKEYEYLDNNNNVVKPPAITTTTTTTTTSKKQKGYTGQKGPYEIREDGKYYCLLCNMGGWAGPSGVWYHMKKYHGAKTRNYVKKSKNNNKRFQSVKGPNFNRFYFMDNGKYKCALCDASFDTASGIWSHLKNSHPRHAYQFQKEVLKNPENKNKMEAKLLLGFAEGAQVQQNIKNAIINKIESLFSQLKNPQGANIFIELIKNDEFYGKLIVDETKRYVKKISIRDKSKIKRITLDFLQTLALIKKNYSQEQLEGFVIEELSEDGTGVIDEDNKEIKILASSKPFKKGGRRKTRRKSKRRKRRKTKRKKKRSKSKTKRRR